jgi:regulator of sigma E protease
LLGWIGLLSVNLGVINLLPIPALDGGRLVFLGAEAVGDKVGFKISTKFENRLHYLMYLLLLGLFVFITYNDILRLIKSIF